MEYLRGYRVVFDDPEWMSKVGVAGLLFLSSMCVPLLGQLVVLGWEIEAMRRDVRGESGLPPLPLSFDAFKPYLELGVRQFIVQLAYSVPMIMAFMPIMVCLQFGVFASIRQGGGPESGMLVVGAMLCSFPLFFAATIAVQVFAIYASIRVGLTGDLSKGFEFGAIFAGVKRIGTELAIGALSIGVMGFVFYLLGIFACFIGVMFTLQVVYAASGILRADLARLDAERGGPPLPGAVDASVVETFR